MEGPSPIFFDQLLGTPVFVGLCLDCSSPAPDCMASTGLLFLLSHMRALSVFVGHPVPDGHNSILPPPHSCEVTSEMSRDRGHGQQPPTISLPVHLRLHELKTGILDGLGREGLSSESSSSWPPTQPCFTSPDTDTSWAVLVIKERCPLVSGQKD